MDPKTLKTLEFDRILARLTGLAATEPGRELAAELVPSPERTVVERRLAETAEAYRVLSSGGQPRFSVPGDAREPLRRAGRGGILEARELLNVAVTLSQMRALRDFLGEREDLCPALAALSADIRVPDGPVSAIRDAITDEGEVSDGASPELSRIRRTARVLQEKVRERINAYLHSSAYSRMLQEPIVTIREGRYVLPVRRDARGDLPGVVHDVSSSGATVFVEPMPCVPLNNELRRTRAAEDEEVRRILADLSGRIGACSEDLLKSLQVFAHLDLVFAKARLAVEQRAERPTLADEPRLEYAAARHPLLDPRSVVPVDLRLGDDFHVLVVTGPNTGGKTVALKTAGLLSAMAQAGLFIPAGPEPVAAVFDDILADIGDEQSIEQNLSTFSAHMGNIVRILGRATERTLVLLDEIGAGTDPTEGTALAMALLEELGDRGSRTIVTTHYGQLKAFAQSHPGVANASVAFDPQTLAPTFRLNIGIPGASNALVIAGRLGLDGRLVARARDLMGRDQVRLEEVIAGLVHEREQLSAERTDVRRAGEEAADLIAEYKELLRAQEREHAQLSARLRAEYREALAGVRRAFEDAVREVRRAGAADDRRELERALTGIRRRLKEVQVGVEELERDPAQAPSKGTLDPAEIRPGLRVMVPRLGRAGYVLGGQDGSGQVPVQVGIIRVMADARELSPAEDERSGDNQAGPLEAAVPSGPQGAARGLAGQKAASFSPEIDLRGQTVLDAVELVEKHLDDALLAGVRQVRIIHGKGTGALRQALTAHLREHPHVKSLALAPQPEGGEGVTLVELR